MELGRTIMQDQKVYFGERELTNLIWTLIRVYRYKNSNQDPEAIVFPSIKDVAGVKVEFPKEQTIEKPRRKADTAGSADSEGYSQG